MQQQCRLLHNVIFLGCEEYLAEQNMPIFLTCFFATEYIL